MVEIRFYALFHGLDYKRPFYIMGLLSWNIMGANVEGEAGVTVLYIRTYHSSLRVIYVLKSQFARAPDI